MRECAWCRGPISPTARRDAITCSKRCRQARARFIAAVGGGSRDTSAPLRLAYARLTDPARVIGAKPAIFARWIFDLLGALPQDHFTDLFPGSGTFDRAWKVYSS